MGLQKLTPFSMMCRMNQLNKNLIISFAEYIASQNEARHRLPYTYSLEKTGQVLFYFGSEHKKDPTHPQFATLHQEWKRFLNKAQNKKSIVIYEGNVNENSLPSLEKAIEQFGESGAIVYLARQANVPYFRPEPTIGGESKELLEEYSKEEVAYLYMMRAIASWLRNSATEDFDEYVKRIVERNIKELGWPDFNFSFESTVVSTHKKIFDREFDIEDKNFIMRVANPMYNLSNINEIARTSSQIRNITILDCIRDYWEKGYNIFVVYGASHAVMQERALEDMIGVELTHA